jgi:hypothetical protein
MKPYSILTFVFILIFAICDVAIAAESPSASANLLNDSEVSWALNSFEAELANPASELNKTRRQNQQALSEQSRFLQKLGQGISGEALYYPYGGFDPLNSFGLSTKIKDVYAQGGYSAGSLTDFVLWLTRVKPDTRAGGYMGPFDSMDTLTRVASENNLNSLAPEALTRVRIDLNSSIEGLYFFDLESNGEIHFAEVGVLDRQKAQSNLMILFKDLKSGELRRFWYFSHFLGKSNPGFARFTEKMKFQTLLIKAAPSMWNPRKLSAELRAESIALTLEPARRNRALVISDQTIAAEFGEPQQIFKAGSSLLRVPVTSQVGFGYSIYGESAFVGNATDLIDSSTLLDSFAREGRLNFAGACSLLTLKTKHAWSRFRAKVN